MSMQLEKSDVFGSWLAGVPRSPACQAGGLQEPKRDRVEAVSPTRISWFDMPIATFTYRAGSTCRG